MDSPDLHLGLQNLFRDFFLPISGSRSLDEGLCSLRHWLLESETMVSEFFALVNIDPGLVAHVSIIVGLNQINLSDRLIGL